MRAILLTCLCCVTACSNRPLALTDDPVGLPSDLGQAQIDLASTPRDFGRSPEDLARPPADLSQPPADLSQPPEDLARPPADLAKPPPDLAQAPPDLLATAPPTCSDGVANGIETDRDCGGCCGGCALGLRCREARDCESGRCSAGRCAAPRCPSCTIGFAAAVGYAVGSYPTDIVTADFDGDGILDVATADQASDQITVLHGNGDGTLAFKSVTATPPEPSSLATGDWNGDGRADLLVLSGLNPGLELLLGTGTGSFTVGSKIASITEPVVVLGGDLDGDGHLDAIWLEADQYYNFMLVMSGGVMVARGNGSGGFGTPTRYPTADWFRGNLRDFTCDGVPDVAGIQDSIALFPGRGNGALAAASDTPLRTFGGMTSGDFDGDGRFDLVVELGNGQTQFLHGDGFGGLTPVGAPFPISPQATYIPQLYAADLDGDGTLDLVAPDDNYNRLIVLPGGGDGSFGAPIDLPTSGRAPDTAAIGDLDGDGRPDLISANRYGASVSVFLNRSK
jgi:hypothetical protein